jgi:hypothetical protein
MIIFFNEDGPYLAWLARHRHGFVLDALRRPTRKRAALHRATCASIKKSNSKATHWTTGRHFKACSLDLDELLAWAHDEFSKEPVSCEACAPTRLNEPDPLLQETHARLTKLGREILDCVIESALIHLDNRDREYALTLSNLAERLGKSPAQISAVLLQLVAEGLLQVEGNIARADHASIYPTATSLRSLATFQTLTDREIEEEMDRLHEHAAA